MYIETSSRRVQGDNAKLQKRGLSFSSKKRLSFNYHMYGGSMGTLKVLVGGNTVFTKSGDQGNKWHKSSVEIFDPRASTVRKGTAIVQQPPFIRGNLGLYRKSIHWYEGCEKAIGSAVATEAIIGADGWSDLHRISRNTHVFSVGFLVKKLQGKLFPSGQLHNCIQAAHFCDPPHIK